MSDIVCVTARKLCSADFFEQLELIAEAGPKFIILREKHLSEEEYTALAERAAEICRNKTELVLHYYWKAAIALGAGSVHLPLGIFRTLTDADKRNFCRIGVSCHSVEDAVEAQKFGADYITAGHVFATDCKKGLAPRGLDFLRNVCYSVDVPVYAIGGISHDNISSVRECGAAGACVMSGFMRCSDPSAFIGEFDRK
ncbi:MAG: thiamine phosphate synthase [Ruminococcus sp.]|uniref:thiamine phosphate synthase n=1 Tax=Ruminococcus sp. TaxID=41978 RepID=UPI0025E67655|nr:thiamine phosphate synthase [Ruminococcus sp.]MCR4795737.1 thiamine phosphate synthase [Ruminococcus sp.]